METESRNPELEALVERFYGAFDNRNGRIPTQSRFADLFIESATILCHAGGRTTVMTVQEFVEPRVALLASGRLRDFSEREVASSTRVVGTFATRISEYEKSGIMDSSAYLGAGTKSFQFAYVGDRWKIVSLCWSDR